MHYQKRASLTSTAAATASAGPAVRRTDALPGVPLPGAGALGVVGALGLGEPPGVVGGVEGEEPEPTVTASFMPEPQWPVKPQM